MSTALAKFISKKVLGETAKNHFGKEDPYFEHVPATRLGGRPSTKKVKKKRKAVPPGTSEHDAKVLVKARRRAYRLDLGLFNFCGIRFGWGSVIGIIPAIGDVLDAFMAMMVFRTCNSVEGGLPNDVRMKMGFNIILDFLVGLVPFLGDLADAVYKCNTRNVVILEKYLREKGAKNLARQSLPHPAIDPSEGDVFDRDSDDEPQAPPPRYEEQHQLGGVSRPEPTRQARGGSGWFSRGGRGGGERDLEIGEVPPAQPPRPTDSTRLQKTPVAGRNGAR